MKLYFVRHGKTQWNLEGRFQGANGDSPLLETSIKELHLLGKHLSHIKFDKIFSKSMHYALENYHSRVYHFIIGIVLSSTILILIPNPGNSESIHYANTSIITLVTAAFFFGL